MRKDDRGRNTGLDTPGHWGSLLNYEITPCIAYSGGSLRAGTDVRNHSENGSEELMERVHGDDHIETFRIPIQWSGYFSVQRPATSDGEPPGLVLAFHGYGQSSKRFLRTFEAWRDRNWLIVAPQGANQFYWERGKVGFSWMTKYMREYTICDNLEYMARLIDALRAEFTYDPNRVVLLGFSQGSAMAYRLAASGLIAHVGVVACGGDLPPDVEDQLDDLDPFPTLIVHGKHDESMHFEKAVEGELAMRAQDWPVETHYFDGAHELPEAALQAIAAWMDERTEEAKRTI